MAARYRPSADASGTSRFLGGGLDGAQFDVHPVVIGALSGQRLGARERVARRRGRVQLGQGDRQAGVGERQVAVERQRLIERTGRFHPPVGMEVGQSLIVEGLGLRGFRGDGVVRGADAGSNRQRPLRDGDQVARCRRPCVRRVCGVVAALAGLRGRLPAARTARGEH
jgi:hypothetical protein